LPYIPVPKDLSRIKTKVFFNLTKRQIICFGSGGLIGIPLFFILRKPLGPSSATLLMIIVMLPFFVLAMYEKNGQPFERYLRNIYRQKFQRPSKRPYKIDNFYAAIQRQINLENEVTKIVQQEQSKTNYQQKRPASDSQSRGKIQIYRQ
jgi:hypothetical protein